MRSLISALQTSNKNDGAGRVDQGEEALLVRVSGAIGSLQDIRDIRVMNSAGQPVPLSQIATVTSGTMERYGSVTADGTGEAVQALVIGMTGANARDVVNGAKAKLAEIEATLPEGTSFDVFYDRSILIAGAVNTVTKALLEAVALVVVLLVLFLGNIRAAVTAAMILPFSALVTFLLMNSVSMTANLMSLGGLVIAIGILVDSAIVVVENIVATMSHHGGHNRLPRLHVIFRAVKSVAVPVTSGILIIIIVFLPLLSLEGLEGKLFVRDNDNCVCPDRLIDFVIDGHSCSGFVPDHQCRTTKNPGWRGTCCGCDTPLLRKALAKPVYVIGLAAALLAVTVAIFPLVGKTFMPAMDEGDMIVQLELIPSINLETSTRMINAGRKGAVGGDSGNSASGFARRFG